MLRRLPLLPQCVQGHIAVLRTLHTSAPLASQRARELATLRKTLGVDYAARTVPVQKLLEGLKDLQSERLITNNNDKSAYYRDGYRDIIQLCHPGKTELTIGEIEQVLTDENAVTWRAIRNLAETGDIPELSAMSEEKAIAVRFNRVHGIGTSRAGELVELGYRTLEDLRNSPGKVITKATRIALAHVDDMEQPIPREEVDVFAGLIREALHKADDKIQFELMGSYRRGERLAMDVDVVVWHEDFKVLKDEEQAVDLMHQVKRALTAAGLMGKDFYFSNGKRKSMLLTQIPSAHAHLLPSHSLAASGGDDSGGNGGSQKSSPPYRLMEIRVCPVESVPYFLLHNTGDDMLMKIFRREAASRGLVINEYGMGKRKLDVKNSSWWVDGTFIPAATERDIFEHLKIPYLEPSQRSFKSYEKIFPRHYISM